MHFFFLIWFINFSTCTVFKKYAFDLNSTLWNNKKANIINEIKLYLRSIIINILFRCWIKTIHDCIRCIVPEKESLKRLNIQNMYQVDRLFEALINNKLVMENTGLYLILQLKVEWFLTFTLSSSTYFILTFILLLIHQFFLFFLLKHECYHFFFVTIFIWRYKKIQKKNQGREIY